MGFVYAGPGGPKNQNLKIFSFSNGAYAAQEVDFFVLGFLPKILFRKVTEKVGHSGKEGLGGMRDE